MKKIPQTISLVLTPKDFENSDFNRTDICPIANAFTRRFGVEYISVGSHVVDTKINGDYIRYKIKGGFIESDCDFVRAKYVKDPKMKKAQYVVSLTREY